jgi:hypothetical protein
VTDQTRPVADPAPQPDNAAPRVEIGATSAPGVVGPDNKVIPPLPAIVDPRAAVVQVLQQYAKAQESLSVEAVRSLYPNVDARLLANTFRDYASLKQEISVDGVELSSDGQTATVKAAVTTAPVVKTGRQPAATTRNITFVLSRRENSWIIQSAR